MTRIVPIALLLGFAGEVASIIWVGRLLGVIPTLLLMVLGAAAGVSLIRSTGVDFSAALRRQIATPDTDRRLAVRLILRTIAGILLIVPGFLSDIIALLLLIGSTQSWLADRIPVVQTPAQGGQSWHYRQSSGGQGRVTVIEGEVVEVSEESPRKSDG